MFNFFFNIYLCTFGDLYGLEYIILAYYFISKYTGYVFQVTSISLNNTFLQ